MRTYAVDLGDGEWGPEFTSEHAAYRWAREHLPADANGRLSVRIVLVRDGREVASIGVFGYVGRTASRDEE